DPAKALTPDELRLDSLLGVQVVSADNRPVARIEEFRAELHGGGCVITHYVLGATGLFERLGMSVRRLFGPFSRGYLARWDQIDLSDPRRPRLTCPIDELQKT